MQHCTQLLSRAGIESAHQEASLLLQHVTGQSLTNLMCNLQCRLSTSESTLLDACLKRRLRREPLQYILGYATFCGRRIVVDPRVLIPRPESELLIEAIHQLRNQSSIPQPYLRLLDVGTGSGAIAVTLACDFPSARVLALDISRDALRVALCNTKHHGVADRVALVQGDLVSMVGVTADIVIANLPYVRMDDLPQLSPEITHHEPWIALDGGADGLSIVRRLCAEVPGVLRAGGWLLLEIGDTQADDVISTLSQEPRWESVAGIADLSAAPRIVTARLRQSLE